MRPVEASEVRAQGYRISGQVEVGLHCSPATIILFWAKAEGERAFQPIYAATCMLSRSKEEVRMAPTLYVGLCVLNWPFFWAVCWVALFKCTSLCSCVRFEFSVLPKCACQRWACTLQATWTHEWVR